MLSAYSTWTEDRKQRKREANARWRHRNPHRFAAYYKTYRQRNKQKVSIAQRVYRVGNKDFVAGLKKAWRLQNQDKVRVHKKRWYEKYKDAIAMANRFRRYGVTQEQYEEMLTAQKNSCAICGTERSQIKRELDIDHCHSTGEVRGLLCPPCNRAVGYFEKYGVELIKYLRKGQ